MRLKTELEKSETPEQEANRLRGALFHASLADDLEEAKRICLCAMRGELHGKEIPPFDYEKLPEWMRAKSSNR